MRLNLLAVGARMPPWVKAGYEEYASRLPRECQLRLTEIPPARRAKNALLQRMLRDEGTRLMNAVPQGCRVVALEVTGQPWSTEQLAEQLGAWMKDGRDVALLIGGPDGLDNACLARAELSWSLSRLTLPHPLVRIVVAEQLYRAWSILNHHPYHRA